MKESFAVRLSQRFMFILTGSVFLLSLGFLIIVRSLVQGNQTEQLKNAENAVFEALQEGYQPDIPYFITFIAYDLQTEEVVATNDPFLPLLKDSKGKALHYFEKDFFYDGDLEIFYFAKTHEVSVWGAGERSLVCAVALNVENDSLTMMFAKLPLTILLMALPVLLLSFLVSLFITKNTINPVVKITKAAQQLTTEKLDGQLPLSGRGDEIDELSRTFNELFLRIKADFDRERQFSSDVSHELNTPLTVISGQANLLLRWGKDNPEQLEKSLTAIKNESKSMHTIIDNLLQISRIESGRIKPELCQVDVKELFERVEHEFTSIESGLKFEITCQSELQKDFLFESDPEMLHQILTVFVANSLKFAGKECHVKLLALQNKAGQILISESDDGPGISEEALPHVFERFYRADEAHTRSLGGSGLGLSIAKTLAEALGADIVAGNLKPHGAQFSVKWENFRKV